MDSENGNRSLRSSYQETYYTGTHFQWSPCLGRDVFNYPMNWQGSLLMGFDQPKKSPYSQPTAAQHR